MKSRGIGFQPVRLQEKKDGNHEHLQTKFLESMTGWNPIPREEPHADGTLVAVPVA